MIEFIGENKRVTLVIIIGVALVIITTLIYVGQGRVREYFREINLARLSRAGVKVITEEGEPVLGNPQAPITLFEFLDFQCPFSKRYITNVFPRLKKEYVDIGRLKIVFKNFPLSHFSHSWKAAEASECAYQQEKFWEYREKLFENQPNFEREELRKYAQELKLDMEEFDSCLDAEETREEVYEDFKEGRLGGTRGVPDFYIQADTREEAKSFAQEFKRIIDQNW